MNPASPQMSPDNPNNPKTPNNPLRPSNGQRQPHNEQHWQIDGPKHCFHRSLFTSMVRTKPIFSLARSPSRHWNRTASPCDRYWTTPNPIIHLLPGGLRWSDSSGFDCFWNNIFIPGINVPFTIFSSRNLNIINVKRKNQISCRSIGRRSSTSKHSSHSAKT